MATQQQPTAILEAMEKAATFVSAMTGIKKMFTDQGWTPDGAEAMTLELFKKQSDT